MRFPSSALILITACASHSQSAAPTPVPIEQAERSLALARRADSAYAAGAFEQAAQLYVESAAGWINPAEVRLNAARALARAGQMERATSELDQALSAGLRDPEQLTGDTTFGGLHGTSRWSGLVEKARANSRRYRAAHADPTKARFVTADIDRFWNAYDLTSSQSAEEKARIYREMYFDPGSDGLRDYYILKIRSIPQFVSTLDRHPRYYPSIRPGTGQIASQLPAMRRIFHKMKALYEDSFFPDVYFVVGRLSSAGTVSHRGLLLGIEQATAAPDSPRDELSPTLRAWVRGVEALPPIVAHELIHFQQKRGGPTTLLRNALMEGGADFIGELISGQHTNPAAHAFGNQHEEMVWRRFETAMRGTDERDWIANGGSDRVGPTWAADLGYYVGYQIAKAYFDQSADKRLAVRVLLEVQDPEQILAASGYAGRFAQAGSR